MLLLCRISKKRAQIIRSKNFSMLSFLLFFFFVPISCWVCGCFLLQFSIYTVVYYFQVVKKAEKRKHWEWIVIKTIIKFTFLGQVYNSLLFLKVCKFFSFIFSCIEEKFPVGGWWQQLKRKTFWTETSFYLFSLSWVRVKSRLSSESLRAITSCSSCIARKLPIF